MKKKLIILGIIIIPIITIIAMQIPKWTNQNKFKEIFDDTSILANGYTYHGLTYLDIHSNQFRMKYSDYDTKIVKGSDIEIKGTVKVKDSNTLILTYDGGSITCSVLNINVLDCDGAVFRRYDGQYGDEKKCELNPTESENVIAAGWDDAYANRQGASYNNPYEKTDPCYQEYDGDYYTGVYNGYLRNKMSVSTYEIIVKGHSCLSMDGNCYNVKR